MHFSICCCFCVYKLGLFYKVEVSFIDCLASPKYFQHRKGMINAESGLYLPIFILDRLVSSKSDRKRFYFPWCIIMNSSVQFTHSVMSDSLQRHGLLYSRPPCPSPTPRVYSNSCPLSQWCHPIISSSVIPFSSCLQSFPASGSFQMSQLFTSGGQSIGVSASASVLPVNIQDWFPLGWTGQISFLSKRLSRVFFNTTVQKHQFFGAQLSL